MNEEIILITYKLKELSEQPEYDERNSEFGRLAAKVPELTGKAAR